MMTTTMANAAAFRSLDDITILTHTQKHTHIHNHLHIQCWSFTIFHLNAHASVASGGVISLVVESFSYTKLIRHHGCFFLLLTLTFLGDPSAIIDVAAFITVFEVNTRADTSRHSNVFVRSV